MLAKTSALVADVTAHMDAYDLFGACSDVVSYLDALTNWYVRRSRDRFWRARDGSPEVESDKRDAYDTLSTALSTLCRVGGPSSADAVRVRLPGSHRRAERPPRRLADL